MRLSFVSLLPLLALGAPALAAPPAVEQADLRESRRETVDDRRDLAQIDAIVDAWTAAVARGDSAAERAADVKLAVWLKKELKEESKEVAKAEQETRQSGREYRRSRIAAPGTLRARDDRMDLADDRRDESVQKAETRTTRVVARELALLQPRFEAGKALPVDYKTKRRLMEELKRLESSEIRRDHVERIEDRGELPR